MNLTEIENTIVELENGSTTFDSCQKLASLYVVKEHLKHTTNDEVVTEYHDILPSYSEYVDCKRRYQRNLDTLENVDNAFLTLLREIYEFLDTLYISTENTQERAKIMSTINKFINDKK